MNFSIVFDQVLVLMIILIVGVVAGKAGIIADGVSKKLSELLLYVTAPMLVLGAFFFEYSAEKMRNGLLVFLMASAFFLITIVLSLFIYRKSNARIKPIMRFTAVFSNCGFMGLPMMKVLYGMDGVFLGSFYIVAFYLFIWTFGITMFSEIKGREEIKSTMKKALLNPAMIAVYVGVIIFVFRIPVPGVVKEAAGYIGDMTMPLSMLIIGSLVSSVKFGILLNDIKAYYASAVRLVLMPLIAYCIFRFAGMPSLPVAIVVTALAMPIAANTTIFAELFDKDALFASKAVILSTVFSIITIPLIVSIL